MAEQGLTKARILAELTKSAHGELETYLPIGRQAGANDPEFLAHLTAWVKDKSEIKDVKVALPVISLATTVVPEFRENAAAQLASLDPILFSRAVDFARKVPGVTSRRSYVRLVTRYLRDMEQDVRGQHGRLVQHRKTFTTLYAKHRINPSPFVRSILMDRARPKGSVFEAVNKLSKVDALEAAGLIMKHGIPSLVTYGAVGGKLKDEHVLLALIKSMSPNEIVTNTKWLEKQGVRKIPALRAAFDEKLAEIASGKRKAATLKTTKAADKVTDTVLKAKLQETQQKQLAKLAVKGNWIVLADKSGSMENAIALAVQVAGFLTSIVQGTVHLIFFDNDPHGRDVTGKTLAEITELTKRTTASGGTNMGAALQWAIDRKLAFDGIVIISDGAETAQPTFAEVYKVYAQRSQTTPPVYFYQVPGETNVLTGNCRYMSIAIETIDLRGQQVDYYSLPNLSRTLTTTRYGVTDEIMDTPLVTLDDVLTRTKGMEVFT